MTRSPSFQFYPDDFLGSPAVARMSHAEIGIYLLLLCFDWNEGGLPDDEALLARMVKVPAKAFAKAWAVVGPCFPPNDGRRFNPRLQKEREKQAEWREKSSRGGKHSAANRARVVPRVVEPPYQPTGQPNGNTPDSRLQTPVKAKQPSAYPAEFERVWEAYPKRAGGNSKREAYIAWGASIKRGADPGAMEEGLHRYAKFCETTNLLGTTWVKQGRTFFGPNESWTDDWAIPLQVSTGKAKLQDTDPSAPGYIGLTQGVPSALLQRLSS